MCVHEYFYLHVLACAQSISACMNVGMPVCGCVCVCEQRMRENLEGSRRGEFGGINHNIYLLGSHHSMVSWIVPIRGTHVLHIVPSLPLGALLTGSPVGSS